MLLFRDGLKLGSAKPEVIDEPYRSLTLAQLLCIENEIDVALRTEIIALGIEADEHVDIGWYLVHQIFENGQSCSFAQGSEWDRDA